MLEMCLKTLTVPEYVRFYNLIYLNKPPWVFFLENAKHPMKLNLTIF